MTEPNLTQEEIDAINEAWREDQRRQAYEEARAYERIQRHNERDDDNMMWRRDQ